VFYEKFHENLLEDKNLIKPLEKASLNMSQKMIKSDPFSEP